MNVESEGQVAQSAKLISEISGGSWDVAVILGSGLSGAAKLFKEEAAIGFSSLPGFNPTTVEGHKGMVVCTTHEDLNIGIFQGRMHYYETGSMEKAAMPARVAARMGARMVISISAVGTTDPALEVGDWVFISDHINLMGVNPLLGVSSGDGPSFVDLSTTYRTDFFRPLSRRVEGVALRKGILAAFSGPTYETPAEVRMVGELGASIVGMSTVPEAVWSRHLGMDVVGLGLIVNKGAGLSAEPLTHAEVVQNAAKEAENAAYMVRCVIDIFKTMG